MHFFLNEPFFTFFFFSFTESQNGREEENSSRNCHFSIQERRQKMVLWYSTHQIVWSMSGVYSLLATLITTYLIYNHLRNWTEPRFQKPIVRILLMVPVCNFLFH